MKLETIHRAAIAGALQAAAATSSTVRSFTHVLLEIGADRFRATGNNGEMQVVCTAPGLPGDGLHCCLPADRLGRVMGLAKGDLDIAMGAAGCVLKAGASRFVLPYLAPEEFALAMTDTARMHFGLDPALLRRVIDRVLPFVARADVRYMLNALYLEVSGSQASFVGSDGIGLAVLSAELAPGLDCKVLFPAAPLRKLKGFIAGDEQVSVAIGRRAEFSIPPTADAPAVQVTMPLVDAAYLDWRRAIKETPAATVSVSAGAAAATITEAMTVPAVRKRQDVRLDLSATGITVSSGEGDLGSYEGLLDCSPSLPAMAGFDAQRLHLVLSQFPAAASMEVGYSPGVRAPFRFTSPDAPGYAAYLCPLIN